MTRHLQSCLKRAAPLGAPGRDGTEVCHLVVQGEGYASYWVHLLVPASARLRAVDCLLRDMWLDCCGHGSAFFQGGSGNHRAAVDMDARVGDVLWAGEELSYVYDFGSSTELTIRSAGRLRLPGRHRSIVLLARNDPPEFACDCGKRAVAFCLGLADEPGGWPLLCAACAEHDCEYPHAPIDNSPRLGVCGYTEGREPGSSRVLALGPGAEPVAGPSRVGAASRRKVAATSEVRADDPFASNALHRALAALVETAKSLPAAQGAHWLGARRRNTMLHLDDPPWTPDFAVWIDAGDGRILWMEPLGVQSQPYEDDDPSDKTLALEIDTLARALASPLVGTPCRPASVTVLSEKLARLLRKALTPFAVDVLVAQGDEAEHARRYIDEIIDTFAREMLHTPPSLATLKVQRKKDLARAFEAAADYYRCAPWSCLTDADPISITLGETTYHAVVLGARGIAQGLALYPDAEADALFDMLALGAPGPEYGLAVVFNEESELDPKEVRFVTKRNLAVASKHAYPQFVTSDGSGGFGPLSPEELDAVAACLKAVALFVQRYRDRIANDPDFEAEETFPVRSRLALSAHVEFPGLI